MSACLEGQRLKERFWGKVDRRGKDDCWYWRGAKSGNGYGYFTIEGRAVRAHRVAYELAKGPLDPGMDALHECDHPLCMNPAHLTQGTQAKNIRDMYARGRRRRVRRNPHCLTAPAVKFILMAYGAGIATEEALARACSVQRSNISMIVNGHRWPHIRREGLCLH
jgi:hypothetical protein